MSRQWRPPSMRLTLPALVKVRLIQALVKSLGKRDFNLANGQVFHLRFGGGYLMRGDEVIDTRATAAIHFGHPSRLTTDPPLVSVEMTKEMWQLVLVNMDETSKNLEGGPT